MTYLHYIFKVIDGKSLLPLRPFSSALEMVLQDQRGAVQLQSLVNYRRGQLREQERSKPLFRRPRPDSNGLLFHPFHKFAIQKNTYKNIVFHYCEIKWKSWSGYTTIIKWEAADTMQNKWNTGRREDDRSANLPRGRINGFQIPVSNLITNITLNYFTGISVTCVL